MTRPHHRRTGLAAITALTLLAVRGAPIALAPSVIHAVDSRVPPVQAADEPAAPVQAAGGPGPPHHATGTPAPPVDATGGPSARPVSGVQARTWDELVVPHREWQEFESPEVVDGVPDYTAEAMAARHEALAGWQERLRALDPGAGPVEQQVDWHLVRAEMNGLDFDHRVRRPWARDPAFYVMVYPYRSDVPAHAGPVMHAGSTSGSTISRCRRPTPPSSPGGSGRSPASWSRPGAT